MASKLKIHLMIRKFGVSVRSVTPVKSGVYRLVTVGGKEYCLKKMGYPLERIRWIDQVLLKLRNEGFARTAWRDPDSRAGRILAVRPDRRSSPYILTPWLQGRIPSPQSEQDLRACAQTLAQFHQVGQWIQIPLRGAEYTLQQWPTMIRGWTELINRQMKALQKSNEHRNMKRLLDEHGSDIIGRATRSLELLNRRDYYKLCERSEASGAVLCHADSGPKNFVLTDEGPALIDFESLRIDLRIYDLFRLIRLAGKKNGWNYDLTSAILDSYQSAAALEPIEYELLAAWLLFPKKAYRALAKYDKADPNEKTELEKKLRKAAVNEQPLLPFVQRLLDDRVRG